MGRSLCGYLAGNFVGRDGVTGYAKTEIEPMTMRDNDGRRVGRDNGFGWGIPAAIVAAIVIIGGLFYFNSGDHRSTTASSNAPATTNSGPVAPGAPAPGPTTTTPAPSR